MSTARWSQFFFFFAPSSFISSPRQMKTFVFLFGNIGWKERRARKIGDGKRAWEHNRKTSVFALPTKWKHYDRNNNGEKTCKRRCSCTQLNWKMRNVWQKKKTKRNRSEVEASDPHKWAVRLHYISNSIIRPQPIDRTQWWAERKKWNTKCPRRTKGSAMVRPRKKKLVVEI